jgi:glycosyltransferase involved in cell wall biosynthesis
LVLAGGIGCRTNDGPRGARDALESRWGGGCSVIIGRLPLTIFIAHPSALLTDSRPHGDGLIAWGYIRGLAARGHEVHVAAERVDLQSDVPDNVHVYPLGAAGRPAALARPRYMWRMRRLLQQLRRTTDIDLIHQLNPVDVGMTLSLFDSSLPVVLGPYWPDFWLGYWQGPSPSVARVKRVVRRAQQRCATTVLLSTPAAAPKLEVPRHGGVRVRELSPGIDTRQWIPAAPTGPEQDVLFLASLHTYKGIFVLLDAFERLSLDFPAASLLIAGVGPEESEVRRRINAMVARDKVSLLGPVERDRVMSVMQSCAVYCLPSYGEPFGMSALEAMACGKPVVVTDAGGLRHIVDAEGGRRVPAGDADALRTALGEILADPALRRTMGSHNRRVIEERFAWPHVIDRLEELYREAIEHAPGAGSRGLRALRLAKSRGERFWAALRTNALLSR